jgi:hypothetical protein
MYQTFINQLATATKDAIAYVPHEGLRKELTTLANAQTEYTLAVCRTTESVGKLFVDSAKNAGSFDFFNATKPKTK